MSRSIGLNETLTEYLRAMNPDEPAALRRCREETATRGDARMQISPEQGAFMAFLAGLTGAKIAVEVGVFTGYSAMAYLQRYEIDFIKIDRSFVSNLEASDKDRAITEAIIVMAHKLGMEVIAEGVEEAGQARLLTDADCDYLQGYRIGRPVSATVFEAQCLGKPGGA